MAASSGTSGSVLIALPPRARRRGAGRTGCRLLASSSASGSCRGRRASVAFAASSRLGSLPQDGLLCHDRTSPARSLRAGGARHRSQGLAIGRVRAAPVPDRLEGSRELAGVRVRTGPGAACSPCCDRGPRDTGSRSGLLDGLAGAVEREESLAAARVEGRSSHGCGCPVFSRRRFFLHRGLASQNGKQARIWKAPPVVQYDARTMRPERIKPHRPGQSREGETPGEPGGTLRARHPVRPVLHRRDLPRTRRPDSSDDPPVVRSRYRGGGKLPSPRICLRSGSPYSMT